MTNAHYLISDCHIIVSGNIASGKTTLINRLEEKLGFVAAHESVEDNPYLLHFYSDMLKWSFHVATYFLGDRAAKHQHLATVDGLRIADRSIYEDMYVFLPSFLETETIARQEYENYMRLACLLEDTLAKPNLHIHLHAPIDVLLSRVRARNRIVELGVTTTYLECLESHYEKWTKTSVLCPLLRIDTDRLNYANSDDDLLKAVSLIEDALGGTFGQR